LPSVAAIRLAGRGETSLQQNELAVSGPVRVEKTIAGRLKRRADRRQHIVDRQRRKIMQHRRRALQKFQIL
jgi:hypothetical protein